MLIFKINLLNYISKTYCSIDSLQAVLLVYCFEIKAVCIVLITCR